MGVDTYEKGKCHLVYAKGRIYHGINVVCDENYFPYAQFPATADDPLTPAAQHPDFRGNQGENKQKVRFKPNQISIYDLKTMTMPQNQSRPERARGPRLNSHPSPTDHLFQCHLSSL
eukprot:3425430-Rhodomonas_salina.1